MQKNIIKDVTTMISIFALAACQAPSNSGAPPGYKCPDSQPNVTAQPTFSVSIDPNVEPGLEEAGVNFNYDFKKYPEFAQLFGMYIRISPETPKEVLEAFKEKEFQCTSKVFQWFIDTVYKTQRMFPFANDEERLVFLDGLAVLSMSPEKQKILLDRTYPYATDPIFFRGDETMDVDSNGYLTEESKKLWCPIFRTIDLLSKKEHLFSTVGLKGTIENIGCVEG